MQTLSLKEVYVNNLAEGLDFLHEGDVIGGGPTELDRNRGALSEALLGSC